MNCIGRKDTRFNAMRIGLIIGLNTLFCLNVCAGLGDWIRKKLPYQLPTETLTVQKLQPKSTQVFLDRFGRVLFYGKTKRFSFYKPLASIPKDIQNFVVLSEDAKFFQHEGFDYKEIKKSIKTNIKNKRAKRGGSTLTQQLAKNLFLDKKKSLTRKIFEVPWTKKLEKDLSKKNILELYLNIVEWGPKIYGIEGASRYFFDKTISDLSSCESLYLALILPNPKRFDLIKNPSRRDFMISKMKKFAKRIYSEKKIDDLKKLELEQCDPQFITVNREHPLNPKENDTMFSDLQNLFSAKTHKKEQVLSLIKEDQERFLKLKVRENDNPSKKMNWIALYRNARIAAIRQIPYTSTLEDMSDEELLVQRLEKIDPQELFLTEQSSPAIEWDEDFFEL